MYQGDGKTIYWDDFFSSEMSILPFLGRYCLTNNLTLNVCGATLTHQDEENDYYKSLLGDKGWSFHPKIELFSSYESINRAEFVVSIDSTLCYESLARGKKTVALSIRGKTLEQKDYNFGWPADLTNNGPFWTNHADEREFLRLMDYITTVSDEEWEQTRQHYVPDLMEYDPGNTRFLKLMRELGVPLNKQYQNVNTTN